MIKKEEEEERIYGDGSRQRIVSLFLQFFLLTLRVNVVYQNFGISRLSPITFSLALMKTESLIGVEFFPHISLVLIFTGNVLC